MEYNKRRFQKANDKKVLHKVKKHWVVMSMALLMAIGGEAVATHVSAHADTANNNGDQNNDSTNTIKERLNQSLVQGQKQAQSNNNQSAQQTNQAQLNSQRTAPKVTGSQIGQQASALHQQIMKNAMASGDLQNGSTQGRTAQNVGAEASHNNNASNSNNVSAQAPKNNVKAPKINSVGNNNVNKVASDVKANQVNVKSDIKNNNITKKHLLGNSNPYQDSDMSSPIAREGRWGTAYYELHNDGSFYVHDGALTNREYSNWWSIQGVDGLLHNWQNTNQGEYNVKRVRTKNITLPQNCIGMFANLYNVSDIDLSGVVDTSNRYLMFMFNADGKLTKLNLSNLNTTGCSSIADLLGGGDPIAQVKLGPNARLNSTVGASYPYGQNPNNPNEIVNLLDGNSHPGTWRLLHQYGNWGSAIWSIDHLGDLFISNGQITDNRADAQNLNWNQVKHIETYNVTAPTNMSWLFGSLSNLQSIDLSGMNTSNVNNMSYLFCSDNGLQHINLGHINTSNVQYMDDMFSHSRAIQSINLGTLNTHNVVSMDRMFNSDSDLTKLVLPDTFDTSKVTGSMDFLFYQDLNLKTLILPSAFHTNPSNSVGMFSNDHGNNTDYNLGTVILGNEPMNLSGAQDESSNDSWINIESDSPQSLSFSNLFEGNQPHPGVWSRNAEILNYTDNNQSVGKALILAPLRTTFNVGSNPTNLPSDYQVVHPNNPITVNGTEANVSVEDAKSDQTDTTNVNVIYETSPNNLTATVPVTLKGRNNSAVDFDPTNLIAPSGYTLDTKRTPSDYSATLANGSVTWNNSTTPTIYFTGNQENNDSVQINQVIESSNGVPMRVQHTNQTVSGDVGNPYTINPASYVPSGDSLAPSSLNPSDSNHNGSVTGQILANNGTSYLSQPTMTFYYVDPNATSQITVDYINQAGNQVGTYSSTQPIGGKVTDMAGHVPNGYTYNGGNPSQFTFGHGDRNEQVGVTGNSENVVVNYQYGGNKVNSTMINNKHVGDTVQLPTNNLPNGYVLNSDQPTSYQISYNDDPSHSGTITRAINVSPVKRVIPVQFVDQNGQDVGGVNYSAEGAVGSTVHYPAAPAGYTYANSDQHTITLSDENSNDVNQTSLRTVHLKGNQETVPVTYYAPSGERHTSDLSGQIGNSVNIPNDVKINNVDYQLNSGQPNTYTFTPENISQADHSKMTPVNVFVHDANAKYQIMIDAQEMTDHKNGKSNSKIRDVMTPVPVSDHVGNVITFHPGAGTNDASNYYYQAPTDYGVTNDNGQTIDKNSPVKVEVTDNGLINASDNQPISQIKWTYSAQNIPNAIRFEYVDQSDGNKVVGGPYTVGGHVDSHITLTNHDGVPAGYDLNNDQQTNYSITSGMSSSNPLDVTLNVHSRRVNGRYYNLNIEIDNPDHTKRTYSESIPITVPTNNSTQMIKPSDYLPTQNHGDYKLVKGNNSQITVTNKPSGLSSQGSTVTYQARSTASDTDIQPIKVQYINQDGITVHSDLTSNDYIGKTINDVTNTSDGGVAVPTGYNLNPGQQVSYTVGNKSKNSDVQTVQLYVEGKKVNALAPIQLIHTSSYFPNQNGSLSGLNVPETLYLPITGHVGDQMTINASDFRAYVPLGYTLAGTKGRNTYNGKKVNYSTHSYQVTLKPSDSIVQNSKTGQTQWNSDSWSHGSSWNSDTNQGDPYWYQGKPLLVLQADDNKAINFDLFDTHNRLIKQIPINQTTLSSPNSPVHNDKKAIDPSYNDLVNISDYDYLIPNGYSLDNSNPTSVRFGLKTEDVAIHLAGDPETVSVHYVDSHSNFISQGSTISTYGNNHQIRVGDTITLPSQDVPKGYHLDSKDSTQYTVNYNDDTSKKGQITRNLTVDPDVEAVPVEFKDQTGQIVGQQLISGTHYIGDVVTLPSVAPQGYQLNSKQATQEELKPSDINPTNSRVMKPFVMDVTGKPVNFGIAYVDEQGNQIGSVHSMDTKDVDDTVNLPTTTADAENNYGLLHGYDLENPYGSQVTIPSTVNGNSDTLQLTVAGQPHQASDLSVHVVYQGSNGQNVVSDTVPVTIDGHYDSMTYFDPASLAVPTGYKLVSDSNAAKDYQVKMDVNGNASWANGQPTVKFQGDQTNNDQVVIDRVIESAPKGYVMSVDQARKSIGGDVGDTYTIKPSDVAPTVNGQTLKADPDQNNVVSGKILADGSTTYLSQPTDVVYYVDPSAKSQLTVRYVNQAGNEVSHKTFSDQPVGTTLSVNNVKTGVPNGYLYDQNNSSQIIYGKSNKYVNVNVTGNQASVGTEYYDGSTDMQKSGGVQTGDVGNLVQLPMNNMPAGYHLANSNQEYTLKPSDTGTTPKTIEKVVLAPNQMTLPIEFMNNGKVVGRTSVTGNLDETQPVQISNTAVPAGYHFSSPQSYNFSNNKNQLTNDNTMQTDQIQVVGDNAKVAVNYVDQNGQVVHTNGDVTGTIGQTTTLPVISGYQAKNLQYAFEPDNIIQTGKGGDVMSPVDVYVNGDAQSLSLPIKVQEEDFNGNPVGSPQTKQLQLGLNNGDTGEFYPSNLNTPDGYVLDTRLNRTAKDYQFSNDNGTGSWTNGVTPTVYFQAEPSTQVPHVIDVTQVKETSDGMILGTSDQTVDVNGKGVGDTYNVYNSLVNAPANFKLTNSDANGQITGQVMPHGLSNDHVILHYIGDNAKLDLQFKINGQNYNVESDQVAGTYGKPLDAMDYLPDNFRLDTGKNQASQLQYTFGQTKSPVTIYVQPDEVTGPSVDVNLKFETPSGQSLGSDQVAVPVNADHNGNFTIMPNDSHLASRLTGFTPYQVQAIKGNVGQVNDGIQLTQNADRTFVYRANQASMPVAFVNQNGQYVKADGTTSKEMTSVPVDGYYGQSVNISNKIPSDYTYLSGNVSDKVMNQTSPAIVMVEGKPVNDQATVNVTKNDPNGHFQSSYQIQVPVNGHVGDGYKLNAKDFAPSGYAAVPADESVSGVMSTAPIKAVNFTYQSTATAKGIQPINVIYLDNGEKVGTDQIKAQTGKNADYDGENVNAAARVGNSLPSGYQLADDNVPATFGTQSATVYVNVKRANGNPLSFNANVVQQFYDPSGQQLISSRQQQFAESGDAGNRFTITPTSVAGYTLESNQPDDSGVITANGLTNGTATYKYKANQSSAKNGQVGPIYITYVNNGQKVGQSDQRIDGYMDQTVDVLDKTKLPLGCHLALGQSPLVTFGNDPQHLNVNVDRDAQKAVGQIVITYHDVHDGTSTQNDKSVTVSDYAGDNFELSPYEENVPQGYQLAGVANNGNHVNAFTNGTQHITINLNKLVSDQVVYKDASDVDDSANMTGTVPQSDIVGRQTVRDVQGTPINYAKYTTYVPNGYKFDHLDNHVENTLTGGQANVIWVKHNRTHIFSTIMINYVEHDRNGKPTGVVTQSIHGRSGDSFDLASYEDQIPEGYEFTNADNSTPIDYFTDHDQTININVKQPTPVPQYGAIQVHFLKSDNSSQGYHEVGEPVTVTGHTNTVFDVAPFEHAAPEGYNYAGLISGHGYSIPDMFIGGQTQKLYIKVE